MTNPSRNVLSTRDNRPLIVDVRRGSHEDGPGLRSVVFFKGCNLRCSFCQNPETQFSGVEIATQGNRCVRCGNCLAICPEHAILGGLGAKIARDRCTRCGNCAKVCPAGAIQEVGKYLTPRALSEVLLRDAAFYRESGGGITLSGGECLLYPAYLTELVRLVKAPSNRLSAGASVVVQTGGDFPFEPVRALLAQIDCVMFDIKLACSHLHQKHTGSPNERIWLNLEQLLEVARNKVIVRLPLVPNVTATRENFEAVVARLRPLNVGHVTLLPYNPMGHLARVALGHEPLDFAPPGCLRHFVSPDEHERWVQAFREVAGARDIAVGPDAQAKLTARAVPV